MASGSQKFGMPVFDFKSCGKRLAAPLARLESRPYTASQMADLFSSSSAPSPDSYDAASIETRDMLRAYAEGVNAFMERGPLPVEYRLLDAQPEPWEPWQSIAAMRQRGILMGSVWFKLWRAAALRAGGNLAPFRRMLATTLTDAGRVDPSPLQRLRAGLAQLRPGVSL